MTTYFWREKNALLCACEHKVFPPTKEELEKELILKIQQKLERIDIIFNKDARDYYYKNDKKPKIIKLEGLSEKEIQSKLGFNVVVDFMQILKDVCDFYNIDFYSLQQKSSKSNLDKIKTTIQDCINHLLASEDKEKYISRIYNCVLYLIKILDFDLNEVEQQRLKKEQKQGSFLLGQYVIIDD